MAAYQYATKKDHELHLAWRRAHYQNNKDKIRERDNAIARKKREEDPERFKAYQDRFRELHPEAGKPKDVKFDDNPDKDAIISRIRTELALA